MSYEVKNVKTWDTMDGGGFQLSLYLDDKRIGQVTDQGWGGDIDFDLKEGEMDKLRTFCQQLPKEENPFSGEMESPCPDSFVCCLINRFETRKKLKKDIKSKTSYIKHGEVWVSPTPYSKEYVKWLRGKNQDTEIIVLNELELEEAVEKVLELT
jgi:hypothetical protein